MKLRTNLLFIILTMCGLASNAQNNQENALATSGGLEAQTTTNTAYSRNTVYGYRAGKLNTNGAYNSFFGNETGSYSNGHSNTFIGSDVGMGSTGMANVFLGAFTGANTKGDHNILIGTSIGEDLFGSNNIIIGEGYTGYNINNNLIIEKGDYQNPLIWGDFANDQLKFNAKVGIGSGFDNYPAYAGGVDVSSYNLFVKGGILTEEVRVSLKNSWIWPDYVFKKDYKLPTLAEVENHITQKGHLINVPSAEEVKNNGIELGEMAKIQQEKIEELTLYIIEQNKINEKQAKELEKQNLEIQELKELLTQITNKK